MAAISERLPANVEGPFFVDASCIDCDACRQIAPATFEAREGQAAVHRQPRSAADLLAAQKALVSCPTASIGDLEKRSVAGAIAAYPDPIEDDVHFCGFTSESSFGAWSYLVRRPEGNLLIDSPRFTAPLVRNIERLGGVSRMFLTHRDDVADHEKFRAHFGCDRVLHADDVTRSTREIEHQPEGLEPIRFAEDFVMIPSPGHTRGHAVFLYRDRFLFSGDHLAWSPARGHLYAFRRACWYSWSEQIRSMERLLDHSFEWVLPGHGRSIRLPAREMHLSLQKCIAWMKRAEPG
ncbi:MAG TPA: MBL fold metallo-hydrolase [Thermoanaerobaculia bacterium]|nr:MBL fold metallo-hydrolase [Thermoanaerobaculia bacterium]